MSRKSIIIAVSILVIISLLVVAAFSYLFFYYGNETYFNGIGGLSYGPTKNASLAFSVVSGNGTFLYCAITSNVTLNAYLMTPAELIGYTNSTGGMVSYILDASGTRNTLTIKWHGTPPGSLLGSITPSHSTLKHTVEAHTVLYVYVVPTVPAENVTIVLFHNSYLAVYSPQSLLYKDSSFSHPVANGILVQYLALITVAIISLTATDYYFLRLRHRNRP